MKSITQKILHGLLFYLFFYIASVAMFEYTIFIECDSTQPVLEFIDRNGGIVCVILFFIIWNRKKFNLKWIHNFKISDFFKRLPTLKLYVKDIILFILSIFVFSKYFSNQIFFAIIPDMFPYQEHSLEIFHYSKPSVPPPPMWQIVLFCSNTIEYSIRLMGMYGILRTIFFAFHFDDVKEQNVLDKSEPEDNNELMSEKNIPITQETVNNLQ